jgi:hypothetical protein
MEEELRPFIKQYDISVVRQYIDNEPELEKQYGSKVPVLVRQDEILCEYFLDPGSLIEAIADINNR